MTKKSIELEDIAGAISDLGSMVGEKFDQVDKRFDGVENRLANLEQGQANLEQGQANLEQGQANLEQGQREMRIWLERIDGRLLGVENDITEIYDALTRLRKKSKNSLTKQDIAELERQFDNLFTWAKEVSKQTGVPLPKL